MCGIAAFFARESSIDYKHLDRLFLGAEQRGQDGFGFVVIQRDPKTFERTNGTRFRSHESYSNCKDLVQAEISEIEFGIGDLIIAIARAAPETEPATDRERLDETVQPIHLEDHGVVVAHNGAISQKIYNELKGDDKWTSDIDSEAIAHAYLKFNRNMKDAMEYLSGGFAVLLYDEQKDMLYVVNDHMQIAHGYIRGLGFFLHSDNDVLTDIISDYCNAPRNGLCLWETFYNHYLDGHAIREIDLQSGFMRKEKYTPRYITPTFDTIHGVIKK
jgi:glucosamine 6-phosphate synthetase-like amidotransferase/phosphosugar isomerase protein